MLLLPNAHASVYSDTFCELSYGLIPISGFKEFNFLLFYANYWIIRFYFVSLQPKAARTGYASAIQVNLIALGLHRPCPREQKDYDYDADISNIERGCDNAACTQGH